MWQRSRDDLPPHRIGQGRCVSDPANRRAEGRWVASSAEQSGSERLPGDSLPEAAPPAGVAVRPPRRPGAGSPGDAVDPALSLPGSCELEAQASEIQPLFGDSPFFQPEVAVAQANREV